MRRLLGCVGCFFTGTDHILSQLGRGIGRLLDCIWKGTDHILTQLGRGMGRLLVCIGCFSRAQIISSPNAGEEWEGSLAAAAAFSRRSYPQPTRERNGQASWLQRLHFQGHRSYPHPTRERIRRLLDCIWKGSKSYPHPIRERNGRLLVCIGCISRAQIISSPN